MGSKASVSPFSRVMNSSLLTLEKGGRGISDNDFSVEILVIDRIKKTFDTFLPASRYRTTILPTQEKFKTIDTCQKLIQSREIPKFVPKGSTCVVSLFTLNARIPRHVTGISAVYAARFNFMDTHSSQHKHWHSITKLRAYVLSLWPWYSVCMCVCVGGGPCAPSQLLLSFMT